MIATAAAVTVMSLSATSYCQSGTTASGTQTEPGTAAMNGVPFGTKIRILSKQRFFGRRTFVVRDRIGHGSSLDLYVRSCAQAINWGRRPVRIRVVYP